MPPAQLWFVEWRHSQYARARLFLLLGCASLVGAVLALSATLSGDSIDRLLDERIALARTAGAFLEEQVEADLHQIRRRLVTTRDAIDPATFAEIARGSAVGSGLILLDGEASVRVAAPRLDAAELAPFGLPELTRRAAERGVAVSALHPIGRVQTLLLVAPVDLAGSAEDGFVALRVEPATTNLLDPLLGLYSRSDVENVSLELVDREGRVVAATDRRTMFRQNDHGDVLATAIEEERQVRGRCHSCHEDSATALPLAPTSWRSRP